MTDRKNINKKLRETPACVICNICRYAHGTYGVCIVKKGKHPEFAVSLIQIIGTDEKLDLEER